MPDFAMWGPAGGGPRQAEMDVLAERQKLGQIAMQPYQIQETAALARYYNATARKSELELQSDEALAKMLHEAGPGGQGQVTDDPATQMDTVASMAFKAGAVDKGMKYTQAAALIRQRESAAQTNYLRQRKLELDAQKGEADLVGRLLADVNDDASWQRAMQLYTYQTGRQSPYAGLPYSSGLRDALMKQSLSVKDRLSLEEKELMDSNQRDFRARRLAQHDQEERTREARLGVERDKEARLAKNGAGKAATGPRKAEVDQAMVMIKRDYSGMSDEDTATAGYSVAAQAKELARRNPGLSMDEALQQAYNQAVVRGDFQNVPGGVFRSSTSKYIGGGKSPATAIAVPQDQKAMVKGRWYRNSKGDVARWTGTVFEPVAKPPALLKKPDDNADELSGDNADADSEGDNE